MASNRKQDWQKLLDAIVADDLKMLTALLQGDASLAHLTTLTPELNHELPHWIYAHDTILHAAAAGHRTAMVRALLKAGADANAIGKHRHARPLHYAADGCAGGEKWNPKKQVETIGALLDAGAQIDAQDKNGATALHRAVRTRCAAAVDCLLERGANAGLRNLPGSTSFHLAVQNTGRGGSGSAFAKDAQREIIRIFLGHGVSPDLKDASGRSVFEWTRNPELRALLVA